MWFVYTGCWRLLRSMLNLWHAFLWGDLLLSFRLHCNHCSSSKVAANLSPIVIDNCHELMFSYFNTIYYNIYEFAFVEVKLKCVLCSHAFVLFNSKYYGIYCYQQNMLLLASNELTKNDLGNFFKIQFYCSEFFYAGSSTRQ